MLQKARLEGWRHLTVIHLLPSFAQRRLYAALGGWCLGLVLVLRKKGYYGLTVLEKQTPLLPHCFNMDTSGAFYPSVTAGDPSVGNRNLQAGPVLFGQGAGRYPSVMAPSQLSGAAEGKHPRSSNLCQAAQLLLQLCLPTAKQLRADAH